jgi:hypothetical protein
MNDERIDYIHRLARHCFPGDAQRAAAAMLDTELGLSEPSGDWTLVRRARAQLAGLDQEAAQRAYVERKRSKQDAMPPPGGWVGGGA